jgi:hypothetical protein
MAAQPNIPTPWIGIEELPVHFANAYGAVPAPNVIFLMFGSVTPLLAADGGVPAYAPVKPIARLALAPAAVPELIKALEGAAKQRAELLKGNEEEG